MTNGKGKCKNGKLPILRSSAPRSPFFAPLLPLSFFSPRPIRDFPCLRGRKWVWVYFHVSEFQRAGSPVSGFRFQVSGTLLLCPPKIGVTSP